MVNTRQIRDLAQFLVDQHGDGAPWEARWRGIAHAQRGHMEAVRMWRRIERAARAILERERANLSVMADLLTTRDQDVRAKL